MTTKVVSSQIRFNSDIDLKNHKIKNASIKASDNQITDLELSNLKSGVVSTTVPSVEQSSDERILTEKAVSEGLKAGEFKLREFVVSQEIFDKYKVRYWNHDLPDGSPRYVLHLFRMMNEEYEEIISKRGIINLNGYESFLDSMLGEGRFNNPIGHRADGFFGENLTFKNGLIYFDNPGYNPLYPDENEHENGCGAAIYVSDSTIKFEDCSVEAPQLEEGSGVILSVSSIISIKDCTINGKFDDWNTFILPKNKDPYEDYELNFHYGPAQEQEFNDIKITIRPDRLRVSSDIVNVVELTAPSNTEGTLTVSTSDELCRVEIDDLYEDYKDLPDGKRVYYIQPYLLENVSAGAYSINVTFIPEGGDQVSFGGTINLIDEYEGEFTTNPGKLSIINSKIKLTQGKLHKEPGWSETEGVIETTIPYWYCLDYINGTQTIYALRDENYTFNTLPDLSNWDVRNEIPGNFIAGKSIYIGSPIDHIVAPWQGKIYEFKVTAEGEDWFNLSTAIEGVDYENNNVTHQGNYWTDFSGDNYLKILNPYPSNVSIGRVYIKAELEPEEWDFCLFNDGDMSGIGLRFHGVDEGRPTMSLGFITEIDLGSNYGFGFIDIEGDGTEVFMSGNYVSIENLLNTEPVYLQFLGVNDFTSAKLKLINNEVRVKSNSNTDWSDRALSLNIDCYDSVIDNNIFTGNVSVKPIAKYSISTVEFPKTFSEGEVIWDLRVHPIVDHEEEGIDFNSSVFISKTEINPDDIGSLGDYYSFSVREVEGESYKDWFLTVNEEEMGFVNPLDYGINFNGDIQEYEDGDTLCTIEIVNNSTLYLATEDTEVTSISDFDSQIGEGKFVSIPGMMDSFNNNAFGNREGVESYFESRTSISCKSLILGGKEYYDIPTTGGDPNVYYIKEDEDINDAIFSMWEEGKLIIDLGFGQYNLPGTLEDIQVCFRNGGFVIASESSSQTHHIINSDVRFENIVFEGYVSNLSSPTVSMETCAVQFTDCKFYVRYSSQKIILQSRDSYVNLKNIEGSIEAYQEDGQVETEFGVTFLKTRGENEINICGNRGTYYNFFRMANDLVPWEVQSPNIEHCFLDFSEGNDDFSVSNFKLSTQGNFKTDGWKAIVLNINAPNKMRHIVNTSFEYGNFSVSSGTSQVYGASTQYHTGDRISREVSGDFKLYEALTDFTASGDIESDISNEFIEEVGVVSVFIANTSFSKILNGFNIWESDISGKISANLSQLLNVDGSTDTPPENSVLQFSNGKWRPGAGGGGGVSYNELSDKPQINSVTLSGNTSLNDLGIQSKIDSNNKLDASLVDNLNFQEPLVSGENIKTINGTSVLGSGNIAVTTYQPFSGSWKSSGSYTTLQFCNSIASDESVSVGMAYLGTLRCNDIPIVAVGSSRQGDAVVEIIGQGTTTKVIHITLSSSSQSPYRWEYTYYNGRTDVGWVGFQPELISGTNIKTINNVSILGSGNIEIQGGGGSSYYKALNVVIQSSDWVTDNTIPGYGYKCEIPSAGVTNQMIPQVYFSDADIQSGNYSSVCETDTNKVIIYSKVNVGITIPAILAF